MKHGHWLDVPRNVSLLWRLFLVVLALSILIELVVPLHPHSTVDALFGFHALYGFFACVAMIVVAKALGYLLKRRDDYYEASDE